MSVKEYISVFSPNAGKCGPEQLRIWTLFTQWLACFYLVGTLLLNWLTPFMHNVEKWLEILQKSCKHCRTCFFFIVQKLSFLQLYFDSPRWEILCLSGKFFKYVVLSNEHASLTQDCANSTQLNTFFSFFPFFFCLLITKISISLVIFKTGASAEQI